MKMLSALLGVGFFESLGTTEWIYLAVGVAAVVALVVTIVVAVKNRKKSKQQDEHVTEATVEPVEEAVQEPAAVVEAQPVAAQPVAESTVVAEQPQQKEPAKVVDKPQPVAEEKPVVTQKPAREEEQKEEPKETVTRGKVLIRYDKSQAAKLMQSDDVVKNYYDVIKNELLSYKGVKCRLSWKHETFRKGRECVAKLKVRGKHLRLLLPLNPNDYVDTKYKVKDLSDKKAHADTPCGYSIKNDRRSVYAKDLIATVMQANGAEKLAETQFVKYSKEYPYDTTQSLIYRKLIKLIYSKAVGGEALDDEEYVEAVHYEPVQAIAAEEVQSLMTDKEAEESVEEIERFADKTKTGIVNVDVLSKTFQAGEKVTLAEIKKRVTGFNKKTTYVKVLARGVIDKPLTVEADDYSIDAVKMILLTGGTVIRTKKK